MIEKIYNEDNLLLEDIDEEVVRVKGIIINKNKEILLGYCHKTYQFPGGHLEDNETLEEGLIREIREETGIDIRDLYLEPFKKITYYSKNYRQSGMNRKNDIYYYIINTDREYNLNNTNLDKNEIEGNYTLKYIPLSNVKNILINSIPDNSINKIIVEEMLDVINECIDDN